MQRLVNVLYPPACLICGARLAVEPQTPLCEACVQAMPRSAAPLCTRCGVRLSGAFDAMLTCAACRATVSAFEYARAPWQYAGAVHEAIHAFKYQHRWRIGRWLAQEMIATAQRTLPLDELTLLVPVPSHGWKRRLTGFDAPHYLGALVARALDKPWDPSALRRRRWTATQTRLSWRARARNVQNAFAARPEAVHRQHVLLIDDVLTSGATAHACAQALKAAGAASVYVLTAARTPSHA